MLAPTLNAPPTHQKWRLDTTWQLLADDEHDTERLGAALAAELEPGSVVGLVGDLGAGKTRLVRAVAVARGTDPRDVISPTFVLVQEYAGSPAICHADAWRLVAETEFVDLGLDERQDEGAILLVEWADRVAGVLPEDRLTIEIEITGETSRRFFVSAGGPASGELSARLRERVEHP